LIPVREEREGGSAGEGRRREEGEGGEKGRGEGIWDKREVSKIKGGVVLVLADLYGTKAAKDFYCFRI
jgi:hypothetical protein